MPGAQHLFSLVRRHYPMIINQQLTMKKHAKFSALKELNRLIDQYCCSFTLTWLKGHFCCLFILCDSIFFFQNWTTCLVILAVISQVYIYLMPPNIEDAGEYGPVHEISVLTTSSKKACCLF